MERNGEQIKNVWKPLCIVFAALLALSWVFFGFLYSKGGVDFSTLENPEQNYTVDNGGAIIGESTGNGAQIMSVQIPVESYAEYGISPMAESAYQLTATITPDTAVDKTVDWSVSFVNPSSSWASGKLVTQYVTVTPTADGALTANVECRQAFGEQIVVTVTSRDVETVSADCVCNYVKRVSFPTDSGTALKYIDGGYVVTVNLGEDKDILLEPKYTFGIGTVEPTVEFFAHRVVANDVWLNILSSYGADMVYEQPWVPMFMGSYAVPQEDIFYELFENTDDLGVVSSFITACSGEAVRYNAIGFCADFEVSYNGETFGSGTWWATEGRGGSSHLEEYWFNITIDAMQSHAVNIELSESELAY